MSKKNKKSQSQCQKHLFLLKPLLEQSKLPDLTSVSFCKKQKGKQAQKTSQIHTFEYPVFNRDCNHATPSFILNSDRPHYSEQGGRIRQQHDMRMVDYLDEKDSLNIPKPKTKNNYCNVCRTGYDDYLMHVQSQNHHQKIKNNVYTRYIDELTQKFPLYGTENKQKKPSFCHHTLTTQGQDQNQIMEFLPKKKIKIQEKDRLQNIQNSVNLNPVQQNKQNPQINQNHYLPFQNVINPYLLGGFYSNQANNWLNYPSQYQFMMYYPWYDYGNSYYSKQNPYCQTNFNHNQYYQNMSRNYPCFNNSNLYQPQMNNFPISQPKQGQNGKNNNPFINKHNLRQYQS